MGITSPQWEKVPLTGATLSKEKKSKVKRKEEIH